MLTGAPVARTLGYLYNLRHPSEEWVLQPRRQDCIWTHLLLTLSSNSYALIPLRSVLSAFSTFSSSLLLLLLLLLRLLSSSLLLLLLIYLTSWFCLLPLLRLDQSAVELSLAPVE